MGVAGAVAGVVNEELLKQFEPELELMKTLVGQLPNKPTELAGRERLSRLSAARAPPALRLAAPRGT
jgi:hypothetical protein